MSMIHPTKLQGYKATRLPMHKCQLAPDRAAAAAAAAVGSRNQVGASIAATAFYQQLQLHAAAAPCTAPLPYILCNGTLINHVHHACYIIIYFVIQNLVLTIPTCCFFFF